MTRPRRWARCARRCDPSPRTPPWARWRPGATGSTRRTAEPRLLMTTLTAFGALAAFLAALGVYGLFSWSVALRQRELAIRLTLGRAARTRWQPPSYARASGSWPSASPAGGCSCSRLRECWAPSSSGSDRATRHRPSRRRCSCSWPRSSPACLPRSARCASIRLKDCAPNRTTRSIVVVDPTMERVAHCSARYGISWPQALATWKFSTTSAAP